MAIVVWMIDSIARETMLFAAVGFLIGGIDDLAIDLIWLARRARRRDRGIPSLSDLPTTAPGRLAVFVAAWDEANVIAAMLRTALARFDHPDYCIYVGTYPNDRATIDQVARVTEDDDRIRLVVGERDGPTTKADNLNTLWRALARDDTIAGVRSRAVILHDAEDVVHPSELRVYDAMLDQYSVVQIPVLPLIDHGARLVSAHYAHEFAEAHTKQMVVRAALGAGLPLAGVGCAISTEALDAIAGNRGAPFDATSVTEDYELGLRVSALGLPACFARVRGDDGALIAVRAYFPSTVRTAVAQKSRWMVGIALAGWDRIGWGRWYDLGDHWMRMRDRRSPLAVLILAAAYLALLFWGVATALHLFARTDFPPLTGPILTVLQINAALLAWRMAMRASITGRLYGWREGLRAIPRMVVANYIALLAVRRAFARYFATRDGRPIAWGKTAHIFPADLVEAPPR